LPRLNALHRFGSRALDNDMGEYTSPALQSNGILRKKCCRKRKYVARM
jgi:hypothetical protein